MSEYEGKKVSRSMLNTIGDAASNRFAAGIKKSLVSVMKKKLKAKAGQRSITDSSAGLQSAQSSRGQAMTGMSDK